MKKILFFIESLSGGGAEQVLVTFLRHLDYTRYDVTLMTVSDTGVHVDDIDYNKVHYRSLLPATENPVRNFWHKVKYKLIYHYLPASWVARWVIPSGYDTYIAFVEGYCTKIVSQMLADRKRIAWVHTNLHTNAWPLQQGIYNSFKEEQECYRQYNKVVCVSHAVEHIMREYYHLGNVTTIYNPIDTAYINYLAGMETVFVPSKDFNLVSVGRLVPQKGYDLLIPIIARLREEGLFVSLYILGEGEERRRLELLIEHYALKSYVHLLGYQTNPHAIVQKMDLFVCSSRAEGYSLAIAEALAIGVPVVSTNCSGPNELLGNNQYGILCNDYDDLYVQIKNVIENPELLLKIPRRTFNRKDVLNIENALEQMIEIL